MRLKKKHETSTSKHEIIVQIDEMKTNINGISTSIHEMTVKIDSSDRKEQRVIKKPR